ncbi:unnamed protein product [Trichobilharzia regenti]|nr:unnamed protein product [Trichobilharzia regenti]
MLTDPISASNSIQARIEVNANQTMERLRKALANRSTSSQLNTMPYVFDASAELRKTVNIGDTSKVKCTFSIFFVVESRMCISLPTPPLYLG